MKQTINEAQFRDAFRDIRPDNFSYAGLGELYEWLEQYGEEVELDVITLCCDFSELTLEELQFDYGYMDSESKEWDLEQWAGFLQEHTFVIPVNYTTDLAPNMNTESLIIQVF